LLFTTVVLPANACYSKPLLPSIFIIQGSAEQTMIRDAARKINDFRVKSLSHSGAMDCNLCLELAHFSLQQHRSSFIQHFSG